MKKLLGFTLIVILLFGIIYLFNFLSLNQPTQNHTKSDSRNIGINFELHYKAYIFPNILIFNLKDVSSENSSADVFRVFLQVASSLKDKKFKTVELSFKGNSKFILQGDYFEQIGIEFGDQNPIYTMRTFPEHLYDMNGQLAYSEWSGGIIGVMNKQLEDLNDFHNKWYKDELLKY